MVSSRRFSYDPSLDLALPQAQVKTGIIAKSPAADHLSATSSQPVAPLKRAALKTNSSTAKITATKTRKSGKQSAAVIEPGPLVAMQSTPPQEIPQQPPPPEQMPPLPANVTYQTGLL